MNAGASTPLSQWCILHIPSLFPQNLKIPPILVKFKFFSIIYIFCLPCNADHIAYLKPFFCLNDIQTHGTSERLLLSEAQQMFHCSYLPWAVQFRGHQKARGASPATRWPPWFLWSAYPVLRHSRMLSLEPSQPSWGWPKDQPKSETHVMHKEKRMLHIITRLITHMKQIPCTRINTNQHNKCSLLRIFSSSNKQRYIYINSNTVSVLCRERLCVVVELKRRYGNSLNEWMNEYIYIYIYITVA